MIFWQHNGMLSLIACIAGMASFACFALFNLGLAPAQQVPAGAFLSLLLGAAAIVLGVAAVRAKGPAVGKRRACAWCAVAAGAIMLLLWAGMAVLIASIVLGEPM